MTTVKASVQSDTDNGSWPVSQPDIISPTICDFGRLFADEFDYVCAVLRRLGVRAGDVEDVAHDVFLVVYRRLDSFDTSRPVRPWLFGIAYRVTAAYRRATARKEYTSEDAVDAVHEGPSAEDSLHRRQSRQLLLQALERISFDRRAILIMHDIDDQPMRVIAETLNIPLFTGYSRLRLARRELARTVKRFRAAEER